jgi:uncharacterized protein YciI
VPTLGIDQLGDDMYVVELDFDDDPSRLDARPAHRERLRALSSQATLVLAGPWADDRGALLVFDLPSEAALQEAMEQDPYYRTPGVTVRRVREWKPITGRDRVFR